MELPRSMKETIFSKPSKRATKISLTHSDSNTFAENSQHNMDVQSGFDELKGELRRETARMNSKMGVLETQMRIVLRLLRKNNKIDVDPEIGYQLNEWMKDDESEASSWVKAWKEGQTEAGSQRSAKSSLRKEKFKSNNTELKDTETEFYTTVESFD